MGTGSVTRVAAVSRRSTSGSGLAHQHGKPTVRSTMSAWRGWPSSRSRSASYQVGTMPPSMRKSAPVTLPVTSLA